MLNTCCPQFSKSGGEPIFRAADGRVLTKDDLRGVTGTARYEVIGRSSVPVEAESLHQRAREAGSRGEFPTAVTLLEQAARLAPQWPYPVYDLAFTYLLMKDAANATKYYRKTVELAPRGFFTALTALDTLVREEKGELPAGTWLTYVSLEWLPNLADRADKLRHFVTQVPGFAPAWKDLAALSYDYAEQRLALSKGLAANPDPETKGILQINKALVHDQQGDRDGAIRLLGELALDPASTWGTEHLAKVTLANLTMR